MGRCQISDAASQQDHSIDHILSDPVIPCQLPVFLRQLLRNSPAGVLASCKKLVFCYLQDDAKVLQDRNVRIAEPGIT